MPEKLLWTLFLPATPKISPQLLYTNLSCKIPQEKFCCLVRDGYRKELGGRGKISQAALFEKTKKQWDDSRCALSLLAWAKHSPSPKERLSWCNNTT